MKVFYPIVRAMAVACFLVVPICMDAQESQNATISTERPTQGFSPDLIPRGSVQVENGINVAFQRNAAIGDLPESLVRFGLTSRLEVRYTFADAFYSTTMPALEKRTQFSDLAISTKYLISGANSIAPKSLILNLSVPSGGPALTSGSYDPTAVLIWTQSFRHGYFLNQVVQGTLTTWQGARRPIWAPSIAGGKSVSAKVTVFGEYAPTMLQDRSLTLVLDGGAAYVLRNLQQFDVRGGYLHDANGNHTILSFGYSIRHDHFRFRPLIARASQGPQSRADETLQTEAR